MFLNILKKKKEGNVWARLKDKKDEGFFILAPMADVTDNPFRKIISEIGKPDLFFTEFVAVDGLVHPQAQKRLIKQILNFEKKQKPIIAQVFGGKPENYSKAVRICADLGFDGIDINMGCPQRNILKQKAGSELIKKENRELVREIIIQAKKGIEGSGRKIPLSVKTRVGFNEVDFS
jgi:tRNA-dihydrouridine synthase